jgi:hypothetical protein
VAFAQAIVSITKVTVIKLTKARRLTKMVLKSQPAPANTEGRVRAPVPTIKLKT